MHGCILAGKDLGRLVETIREVHDSHGIICASPFGVAGLRTTEDAPGQSESRARENRRTSGYKFLVVESQFTDVERHVLNLLIIVGVGLRESNLEE